MEKYLGKIALGLIIFIVIGYSYLIFGQRDVLNHYELTYKIYYPENTITKTVIIQGLPHYESHRGSNYLQYCFSYTKGIEINTTAPIEIISCTKLP